MGIAEVCVNFGQLSGYFFSPYILNSRENGYWIIFLINASILAVSVAYVLFFIPETIASSPDSRKSLFRLDHLKDIFNAVMKKRSSYGRSILFLTCTISFLSLLTVYGEASVKYLSVIKEFGWGIKEFTQYNTGVLLGVVFFSGFGLWIGNSVFRFGEDNLLLFSTSTRAVSGVLMGMSSSPLFFYIVTLVGATRSFTEPLVRTSISKMIPQSDVGKIYSFLASAESLAPQVAIPIYCAIYAKIVGTSPLYVYFISAALCGTASIIIMLIMILKKIQAAKSALQKSPEKQIC